MTLTLRIEGFDDLGNGVPTDFVLNRRGATIGRAPTCDWCLPDPQRYISSRHCEIAFRDGAYWLTDVSTNGTYLNGSTERLNGDHQIEQGDVISLGRFTINAELHGMEIAEDEIRTPDVDTSGVGPWGAPETPPASSGSDEWGDPQSTSGDSRGWDSIAPQPAATGGASRARGPDSSFEWGASSANDVPDQDEGWASHDASGIPHGGSIWEGPQERAGAASEWSSAAPDRPPPPKPTDIWGQIAEDNVVDWARSGFGSARQAAADPLTEAETPSFGPGAPAPRARTQPPAARAQRSRVAPDRTPTPSQAASDGTVLPHAFLTAAGLDANAIKANPSELLARAGGLVRSLVAGLYLLVQARARAKAQLGAESTRLEFDGNNAIKFARSPEEALAQLISPPERGFMDGQRAIEDAFYDLQSHQMATLKAMQGALQATLDRFSPSSIRARAADAGFLASILPAAKDAALWQAYEREFSGVASGSDEAFMDVFAKEFRKAYEEQSNLARQSAPR